jgi:hypothetical protein
MADSRQDPPIQLDTSRSLWIGWGAELVSLALSFLVGGNFFPYLCLFIAIVLILRGWKPAIFAHHIDAQLIAGTPYRREESLKLWTAAAVIAVTLAGLASLIHSRTAPNGQDISLIIKDAVTKAFEQQAKTAPSQVLVPSPEPRIEPAPQVGTPKDQGSLVLKLTPYVVVERVLSKSDNPDIQGSAFYSFGLVLYAQNNYRMPRNIRQIEISGNAPLDLSDYIGARARDGASMDEFEKEFIRRKPYYSLSLVTYPKAGGRIEGDGAEKFVQFDLMKPNAYGVRISNVPEQDYLGYKDTATPPKKLTTEPNLKDLVTFSRRDPRNYREWQGPKLRKEITDGTIKFVVVVDSTAITLQPNSINPVRWTLEKRWQQDNPAELYFEGEHGYAIDRDAIPGHDPAVRRTNRR